MTAAVALVLEHAFEVLGLRRVKAYAAPGNAASRHVLEANGLTEQGVERLGTVVADGRVDAVLYDVLREEWARRAERHGQVIGDAQSGRRSSSQRAERNR